MLPKRPSGRFERPGPDWLRSPTAILRFPTPLHASLLAQACHPAIVGCWSISYRSASTPQWPAEPTRVPSGRDTPARPASRKSPVTTTMSDDSSRPAKRARQACEGCRYVLRSPVVRGSPVHIYSHAGARRHVALESSPPAHSACASAKSARTSMPTAMELIRVL